MTDTERLERKIKESGLKKGYIASELKLSRYGLYRKINNELRFNKAEEKKLCKLLNISPADKKDIFFNT